MADSIGMEAHEDAAFRHALVGRLARTGAAAGAVGVLAGWLGVGGAQIAWVPFVACLLVLLLAHLRWARMARSLFVATLPATAALVLWTYGPTTGGASLAAAAPPLAMVLSEQPRLRSAAVLGLGAAAVCLVGFVAPAPAHAVPLVGEAQRLLSGAMAAAGCGLAAWSAWTLVQRQKAVDADRSTVMEAAERAARARSHLLGVLSHELRTPAAMVVALTEEIMASPGLDPELRRSLATARDASAHEISQLRRLLDLDGTEVVDEAPPPAAASSIDLEGQVVLVVDDLELNRKILRRLVERLGGVCEEADGGESGVERWAHRQPDLVLMDMQMPEVDGLEATRRIRAAGGRTPILAVTANATDDARRACLEAGMDGYLTKPLRPDALLASWRQLRPSA